MNDLLKGISMGVVRHLVTAGGAYLIAHGLMDGTDSNNLLGSAMFLAGLAWSVWDKYQAQQKVIAAGGPVAGIQPQGGV